MALGTFTVTINGDQLDAGTETTAKLQVQFAGDQEYIKDAALGKFIWPHLTNNKAESISLPYSLSLPTDVTSGLSSVIGYTIRVVTAHGGKTVAGPFWARPNGSTTALTDLAADFTGTVPEDIALRAETARDEAEAASTAAQAVGSTNDTVIAGRLSDRTSASAAVLAANNESTTSAFTATGLTGVAGTKLTIPTHVSPSGGETTHPSVVAFPQKWNGYRYWMAHTPYAAADVAQEDPNVCASQDGVTWSVPAGLTNPIQDAPGGTDYNSDTELVYGPDGKLWLFWRRANTTLNVERVYLSTSSNGTSWSTPTIIQETSIVPLPRLLSPTLIFEDGAWTMWGVNMNTSPNTLVRYRSSGPTLTSPSDWGAATTCTIGGAGIPGKEPWHVQVRKIGGQYVGLLTVCDTATSGNGGELQAIVSDSGFTFVGGTKSAIPTINKNDHNRLYRATFVPEHVSGELVLRTWYSAVWSPPTGSTQWNVFGTNIRGTSTGGVETVTAGRPVPAGTPANRIIVRPKPGGAGEVARNGVTNPSPTTDIDYWGAGFSGTGGVVTHTRETSGGPGAGKGAVSWAKKIWTTAPSSNASYHSYGSNVLDNVIVTGNTVWTLSAWLYTNMTGCVTSVRVIFYDSAGTTLGGGEIQGMYYTHAQNTWERRHLITTTPTGAVRAAIRGYFQNVTPVVGTITGMSSLYASAGDIVYDYHDGALSLDPKLTPSWLGAAYESASVLTSTAAYTQAWDGDTAVSL